MARSWQNGYLAVFTSLASLVHSQLVTTTSPTFETYTPTCTYESAATTGFTVPQYWCDCTTDGDTATSTYATKLGQTGAAACSWTIVDAGQASNTISPGPASIQTETASPGGPFFNELAWCAVADYGNYPLMSDSEHLTAGMTASEACSYTTRPASSLSLTLVPTATTTCTSYTSTAGASFSVVPSQACACVQGVVTNFYAFTSGSGGCVYTEVPSSTVTFSFVPVAVTSSTVVEVATATPTIVGTKCGSGTDCENGGDDCKYQCVNNYAVSFQ